MQFYLFYNTSSEFGDWGSYALRKAAVTCEPLRQAATTSPLTKADISFANSTGHSLRADIPRPQAAVQQDLSRMIIDLNPHQVEAALFAFTPWRPAFG